MTASAKPESIKRSIKAAHDFGRTYHVPHGRQQEKLHEEKIIQKTNQEGLSGAVTPDGGKKP